MEAHYSSTKLAACLALAAAAVLVPPCTAQNSPEDFVDLHNAARAEAGVGPVSCGSEYYGENILVGGAGYDWSASDAVGYWVAERHWYDHGSNSCSAPEGESCGHYTQVVWRDSVTIGCARAVCSDGSVFFTCNYSPPGNYIGESPY
ncbi:unnamed protein product [Urochloa decumbens]|uniref:SCP domain-containing protein n=1 Tax=Urochloa decumbens TaxID=240449 RepID=A0ABC9F139_9POAL